METRGLRAAVVCTEPFLDTAKEICEARGVPDYSFAVVAHPIGSLRGEELEARAEAALPVVLEILGIGNCPV